MKYVEMANDRGGYVLDRAWRYGRQANAFDRELSGAADKEPVEADSVNEPTLAARIRETD
jgi:hypothetical protein